VVKMGCENAKLFFPRPLVETMGIEVELGYVFDAGLSLNLKSHFLP
jgi:hypothetical protein